MSSPSKRGQPPVSSVSQLDLQQWTKLVDQFDDPAVAHAVLEVFESEYGNEMRKQYAGIYLQLKLTKHQERVSFAQAQRRKETMVRIGRMFGSVVRTLWLALISRSSQSQAKA